MPTFVALLRGVNVGKAKRVPMAELRALLSGLGYTGVATLLNSGNAVFRARERHTGEALGRHCSGDLCPTQQSRCQSSSSRQANSRPSFPRIQ